MTKACNNEIYLKWPITKAWWRWGWWWSQHWKYPVMFTLLCSKEPLATTEA